MRWMRPVGWESPNVSRFPRGRICLCISRERRTTAESIRVSNDNIFPVISSSARPDARAHARTHTRRPGHTLIHSTGSQLCAGYKIAAVLLAGRGRDCVFRNISGRILNALMKKIILFGNNWNICASVLFLKNKCKDLWGFWKSRKINKEMCKFKFYTCRKLRSISLTGVAFYKKLAFFGYIELNMLYLIIHMYIFFLQCMFFTCT